MKALFGVVSLLLVLGIVSLLVKKQLPAGSAQSPQQQSQQMQQQVKQQVEAAMQQARPVPDDK
jgi:L-lactate permease